MIQPPTLGDKDQQLRQRILKACHDLFFKYGVRSVTMDDIANALGMSKKTIYQHFPNKDEIIVAVVHEHLAEEKATMRAFLTTEADPIKALLDCTRYSLQMFESMNPALPTELKKHYPDAWGHLHDYECQFWVGLNVELIRKGQAEGLFYSDLDAELLAMLHTEGFDSVVFSDNPQLARYSLSQRYEAYERMFLYSLVTEKGRQRLLAHLANP